MIYTMRDDYSKIILKIMCKDMNSKDKTMIEIGSYAGESTEIFAQNFKYVWAIDPWLEGMMITEGVGYMDNPECFMDKNVEKIFDERMKGYPNVSKIKDFDKNCLNDFVDESIDFIYIDALHTETELIRQINSWLPKIKKTGIIGGHDYAESFPGVIEAVHKTVGMPDKIYMDDGNSWSKYKCI